MDPQLDVNALIKTLAGIQEFVAFAYANRATGLTYNPAARNEFLAKNVGTQSDLDILDQTFGITLITDVTESEIDVAAARLQIAFQGDPLRRVLQPSDARILATVWLKQEGLATGDVQLFKRARDLGLAATHIGSGRAAARALAYAPRPVSIPGGP